MSQLPESVVITDDTMREGLQIESADIPVSEKLRLLDALGETGAKVISIGSFAAASQNILDRGAAAQSIMLPLGAEPKSLFHQSGQRPSRGREVLSRVPAIVQS